MNSAIAKNESRATGIQSIEVGMKILASFGQVTTALSLSEIARMCGMPRAKAHKYLVSFERTGFVMKDPGSGHYTLGQQALHLGLAALAQIDFVRAASAVLPQICKDIGQTVFIAVWGERGATIVRWEETGMPIALNVRVGSIMPLLRSATGQVFGAFLPPDVTSEALQKEIAAGMGTSVGVTDMETASLFLAEVRHRKMGIVHGNYLPGVTSVAFPVFDQDNHLAGVITALGLANIFNADPSGPLAIRLMNEAKEISRRLGGESGLTI